MAYRWFLGFGLQDKVPNASTLSQNRRRRFNGTSVAQDIFRSYLGKFEEAVEEDRRNHEKKPLKKRIIELEEKQIKQSTTDPESGYMVREGKPKGER